MVKIQIVHILIDRRWYSSVLDIQSFKGADRFAALENLDDDVLELGETITENIKISAKESLGCYELKQHKPWFD
jgi:hypothetical protein